MDVANTGASTSTNTERKFGVHIVTARTVSFPVGGEYYEVFFENGYGCSIIRHQYLYGGDRGLWEIAVLHGPDQRLCYKSPITNDVIGYLTEDQVTDYLDQIAQLPSDPECIHSHVYTPVTPVTPS